MGVRESDITWYYANRGSHIANVYGMAANEKKDAPYKVSCKSGRKVEATEKEIVANSAVDTNCICGKTHEGSHRLSPGQNGGGLLESSPFHGYTSIPTCSRQMRR